MNRKTRRNLQARQNWKNKVKRRKLEGKIQTAAANVDCGQELTLYVDHANVAGELSLQGKIQTAAANVDCGQEIILHVDHANVAGELNLQVNDVTGEVVTGAEEDTDDIDFSTVKIRRERVRYSREEEEKLKELMEKLREFTKNKRKKGIWSVMVKLGKGVFKECRTAEDLRVKWRSMESAGKEEGEVQNLD